MQALLRSRFTWLSALAIVALCATVVLAALLDEDTKVEDLFSYDLYNSMMAYQVKDVSEIVDDFEWQQYMYLPIAVPDPDFIHVQSGGILPFDTTQFPADFLKGLVPIQEAAVTMYPITVYEDPNTRERVILNAKDEKIGGQYSPWSYDPQWFVKERYPSLSTMDSEYADWLIAMYDPSRIVITYKLILEDDLIKYVWARSIAAALAEEEELGGGMMKSSWSGTVTNLQFVEIYKTNDCMAVVLGYPDSYKTNSSTAFEIFTCDGGEGLIDFWWDLGTVTNVDTSTNFVEWIDTESSNSYVDIRFYAAAVSNDVDGDGFTDGFEKYVSHTVVTNEDSYPVAVSGSISYTGSLTGPVRMIAVTASNSWVGCMETISSPGAYTNDKVANGESYWFKAYRDCNSNKTREYGEPWGVYTNTSILATNSLTGIDITLTEDTDEDDDGLPDWWELQYFGSIWTQDGDDDSDGDSLINSAEYTYGTNPANADTDNDRLNDYAELFTYSTCPTNADTDCDNMGDGTEVDNGMSPSTSNTYATLPFFEDFELFDKLAGSTSATNFGYSLDLDGDRLVVGALGTTGATNGLAYVFVYDGSNWNQQGELHPWASTDGDSFGCSVATRGNRIIVGASNDSTNGSGSGAAYVYYWTGSAWSNEVKLAAYDGASSDRFGFSVGMSSNTIAIGAPFDDSPSTDSGAVYLYSTVGASWWTNTPTKLTDSGYDDRYGCAVDFSPQGEVLAIGEYYYGLSQGAVSVFRWSGTAWTDKLKLYASDFYVNQMFGRSVSLDDDLLLIGAPGHTGSGELRSGAAYVFELSPTNWAWTEAQKLKPTDLQEEDNFGHSVTLSSNLLAVGAYRADASGTDSGAAYLYESDGTNWSSAAKVSQNIGASAGDMVGLAVGLTEDTLLVSAHTVVSGSPPHSGAVYALPVTEVLNWGEDADLLLHDYNGWQASPTNKIVLVSGSHSGALAAAFCESFDVVSAHQLIGAHGLTNVWIDCYVKVNPSNTHSWGTPSPDSAPEWLASLFAVNEHNQIVAYNGDSSGGAWHVCTNICVSSSYNRYTVKQDYVAKTWDLYLNGTNVLFQFGFRDATLPEFSRFSFTGKWADDSYLDDISIGVTQPSGLSE